MNSENYQKASEQLQSIVEMLKSKDRENHLLALSIIEETHEADSVVALLLTMKLGYASPSQWEEDAPRAFRRAKELLGEQFRDDLNITYKTIFDIMTKTKQKEEQVVLFMNYFTEYLTNQLQQMGYTFIKNIKIEVDE